MNLQWFRELGTTGKVLTFLIPFVCFSLIFVVIDSKYETWSEKRKAAALEKYDKARIIELEGKVKASKEREEQLSKELSESKTLLQDSNQRIAVLEDRKAVIITERKEKETNYEKTRKNRKPDFSSGDNDVRARELEAEGKDLYPP